MRRTLLLYPIIIELVWVDISVLLKANTWSKQNKILVHALMEHQNKESWKVQPKNWLPSSIAKLILPVKKYDMFISNLNYKTCDWNLKIFKNLATNWKLLCLFYYSKGIWSPKLPWWLGWIFVDSFFQLFLTCFCRKCMSWDRKAWMTYNNIFRQHQNNITVFF